jgi:hypothetical protein
MRSKIGVPRFDTAVPRRLFGHGAWLQCICMPNIAP